MNTSNSSDTIAGYIKKKYLHLKLEFNANVLSILLDRPKARHAYSIDMIEDLESIFKEAQFDQNVHVLILSGTGETFSAGGDLKAMKSKEGMFAGNSVELEQNYRRYIQRIPIIMEAMSKPIIAAINGPAIGAGLDLACMCDIRLAHPRAIFAESFVKLGLVPGDGGSFFLQRIIGYSRAMEVSLTGRTIDAQEALKIGLITKVCENLTEESWKLATRIAKLPTQAIEYTKNAIKLGYRQSLQEQLNLLSSYQGISQTSSSHQKILNNL